MHSFGVLEILHTEMSTFIENRDDLGIMGKKEPNYECPGEPMHKRRITPRLCPSNTPKDKSFEESSGISPLGLKPFTRLFILYAIGIVMSIVTFLLEFVSHQIKN